MSKASILLMNFFDSGRHNLPDRTP